MHKLLKVTLVAGVLAFAAGSPSYAQNAALVTQIQTAAGTSVNSQLLLNLQNALSSTTSNRNARALAITTALNALLQSLPANVRSAVAIAAIDYATRTAGASAVAQQNARLILQAAQANPEIAAAVNAETARITTAQASFTPIGQAEVGATGTQGGAGTPVSPA